MVYVADIPFHLIAGPALTLLSDDPATEEYLSRILLNDGPGDPHGDEVDLPWWRRELKQSDHGILLKIDYASPSDSIVATEILVYAAADVNSNSPHGPNGMLTPPRSSSPGPTATHATVPCLSLKLYALLLDSRRLASVIASHDQDSAGSTSLNNGEARFILHDTIDVQTVPNKRRKLSNVFDDATYQRRRLKGRGGESISQAMAEVGLQQQLKSADSTKKSQTPETPQQPDHDLHAKQSRKSLSRASSTASLTGLDSSRPPSRRSTFVSGKRSALSRVESAISASNDSISGESDNGFSQQNKSTLVRIVMAGMRMYGLQQHKKPPKTQSQPSHHSISPAIIKTEESQQATTANGHAEDHPDDYKAIYHQTFKAACFTFRAHLAARMVPQEDMRDVVDRLLALFCVDPLQRLEHGELASEAFGSQEERSRDVFDRPSSTAVKAFTVETPSSRKGKLVVESALK